MSLRQFLFYITEEDGRSLYISNGVISSRGTRTPLQSSPDGWQEIAFAWEKNLTKHGINRNFSKELSFPGDGATILRDVHINQNIDRKLFLIIQQLQLEYTGLTYKWKYVTIYKGEFDFSTGKYDPENGLFKVSLMQGGLSKLLNSGQQTTFFIPFDDDAVTLLHDGIDVKNVVQGIVQEKYGEVSGFYFKNHIPELNLTVSETMFFGGSRSTQRTQVANSNSAIRATGKFFFKATVATDITIEYNLKFLLQYTPSSPAPNPGAQYGVVVRQIDESNVSTYQEELFLRNSGDGFNGSFNPSGTVTMSLQPGDELYLYAFCTVEGVTGDEQIRTIWTPDENTIFKASFTYRHPPSFVKCYTRAMLFRKLCQKIFGHEDYAVSSLLASDNRLILSGTSLRGLNGAGIKTSLNDFFTDLDTDLMAGMGIENGAQTAGLPAGERIVIEERTRFYDFSSPIHLGEVKDLEIDKAKDFFHSLIKTGWKDPSIEAVNGKYEFNATQQYTTPIKRVNKELLLLSPYKAGPVDMELFRINTEGQTTTDNDSDNDTFVIVGTRGETQYYDLFSFSADGVMTKPSGFYLAPGNTITVSQSSLNDGTYEVLEVNGNLVRLSGTLQDESSVACLVEIVSGGPVWTIKRQAWDNDGDPEDFGVVSPTSYYNYDLSPKRKLLRHKRWIKSMCMNYPGEKILFQSGTMNTALKTVNGSETIRENADINLSDMGDEIFAPLILRSKKDSPTGLYQLMEDNPNRCFSIEYNGAILKGIMLNCGLAVNTMEEQEYSLLADPANDYTNVKP